MPFSARWHWGRGADVSSALPCSGCRADRQLTAVGWPGQLSVQLSSRQVVAVFLLVSCFHGEGTLKHLSLSGAMSPLVLPSPSRKGKAKGLQQRVSYRKGKSLGLKWIHSLGVFTKN